MKLARTFLAAALLAAALPASAAETADDEGWQAFGHALTLAQTLISIAARSDSPQAGQKALDELVCGLF
jgi:hypothetical protein